MKEVLGALVVVAGSLAAGCSSSGDANGGISGAQVTPEHSSLEIYSALTDAHVCVGRGDTLYVPSWDSEAQVWAAPCANDNASKSRCMIVEDETLEIESDDLEGSICRQGPGEDEQ